MANPQFANLGDIWKHLLLAEVISCLRPEHYIETHAGSAIYRVIDDVERSLGTEIFLSASSVVEPLRSSPYRRHILEFARGAAPSYPGSPLLAMMLLGHARRYVFCDTDPASVADLHAARERLGLRDKVRLVHDDGLATTTALLQAQAIGAASLVHVDPFDFRAAGPGIVSALELVTCLAAASIPTFAWYGLTAPSAAHELFHEVTAAVPATRAWCAELRVCGRRSGRCGERPTPTFAHSTSRASQPIPVYASRLASSHPHPMPAEDAALGQLERGWIFTEGDSRGIHCFERTCSC